MVRLKPSPYMVVLLVASRLSITSTNSTRVAISALSGMSSKRNNTMSNNLFIFPLRHSYENKKGKAVDAYEVADVDGFYMSTADNANIIGKYDSYKGSRVKTFFGSITSGSNPDTHWVIIETTKLVSLMVDRKRKEESSSYKEITTTDRENLNGFIDFLYGETKNSKTNHNYFRLPRKNEISSIQTNTSPNQRGVFVFSGCLKVKTTIGCGNCYKKSYEYLVISYINIFCKGT